MRRRHIVSRAAAAVALAACASAVLVPASEGWAQSTTTSAAPTQSWSAQVVQTDQLGSVVGRTTTTLSPTGAPSPTSTVGPTSTVAKAAKSKNTKAKSTSTATTATSAAPTAGLTALAAPVGAARGGADDPAAWAALRKCESGGRYDLNTGNGYYGAYQFSASTWQKIGYSGYPHEASSAVQDEAARKLQAKAGWGPWPECARRAGLL